MAIKLVVAVTDTDWFNHLSAIPELDEVNFWAPGAASFRALQPGELFLFKLHAPLNFIVGGGIFAYANTIPVSLAWEAFGPKNGANSLEEMRARIAKYRRAGRNDRSDFTIGCRILTDPFFLRRDQWIEVPKSWSPNIVTLKSYSTDELDGRRLWEAVQAPLAPRLSAVVQEEQERFGEPYQIRPRLVRALFGCSSRTPTNAVARSLASGPCPPWMRPTSCHTVKAARMKHPTAFYCGGTSIACSTWATSP